MASGQCAACGEDFTGLGPFDKHQVIAYGTDKPVTCLDPASVGLVKNEHGRWGTPATDDSRARLASLAAGRGVPRGTGYPPEPEAADFDSGEPA
jgi:hypothetical protein